MLKVTLAALTLALTASAPASAQLFGSNLVVNGNAETGTTTGFATTGAFTTEAYGNGGFPGAGEPGVSEGGTYLFAGGDGPASSAAQIVDVSTGASIIDFGTSTFTLSALLGGYSYQNDNAILAAAFFGAAGDMLGSATIGPVLAADRSNLSGLLARSTTGVIPIGTRSVNLLLSIARTDGSYNDGYADNLSLILDQGTAPAAVPEPVSWAMVIAGFGLIGCAGRYRRRAIVRYA